MTDVDTVSTVYVTDCGCSVRVNSGTIMSYKRCEAHSNFESAISVLAEQYEELKTWLKRTHPEETRVTQRIREVVGDIQDTLDALLMYLDDLCDVMAKSPVTGKFLPEEKVKTDGGE